MGYGGFMFVVIFCFYCVFDGCVFKMVFECFFYVFVGVFFIFGEFNLYGGFVLSIV